MYDSGNGLSATHALARTSFRVNQGEFVAVVGPSGCGKTTLLRILGGLLQPSKGRVLLRGEPLTGPRAEIGYVFQHANLMPWRTVERNVALPLSRVGTLITDEGLSDQHAKMLENAGITLRIASNGGGA